MERKTPIVSVQLQNRRINAKIEVPAHNVTAAAFGGPNLDILYITSARVDMDG
ncbi:SMP-30/gluconolactonase/LRE family protein [Gilvibacter sp.]|uniref:SMP-30/gluconolactonase/LRE family protein n=1 Tax=Gilvibacter sp. TaxID=2729997 RepID=UPI003F4A6887